ncbi:hypothetical protein D3C84_377860 [compost metagenome]
MIEKVGHDPHGIVPSAHRLQVQVTNHLVQQVCLIVVNCHFIRTWRELLYKPLRITRHQQPINGTGTCTKFTADRVFGKQQQTLQGVRPTDPH